MTKKGAVIRPQHKTLKGYITMKELRGKKAQEYNYLYWHRSYKDLHDCYKNPSVMKIHIFNYYTKYVLQNGGYGLRILSYNSNVFTLGYLTVEHIDDKPAGFLNVITPCHKYKIKLS